jgi:predicted ArsR family transcriptional regulator
MFERLCLLPTSSAFMSMGQSSFPSSSIDPAAPGRRGEALKDRIRAVARLRTEEGYMAEFEAEPDGSFQCPLCAAAKTCQGLCGSELELFRAAFGTGTSVIRQDGDH